MLKLGRVTKVKVLFLVRVFVLNFDLFKFSATILEKGLLMSSGIKPVLKLSFDYFDRSTKNPPFDTQRISKSSTNFFADVPSQLCNKLQKEFTTSLDIDRRWPLVPILHNVMGIH